MTGSVIARFSDGEAIALALACRRYGQTLRYRQRSLEPDFLQLIACGESVLPPE